MWRIHALKTKRGFTLIEIMVVVSIIGILVSILVLSFNEARQNSRDNARKASLKQLQLALETYKAQNGRYPEKGCSYTGTQWVGPGLFGSGNSWGYSCAEYIAGLVPNFIAALPNDPNKESEDGKGFIYQVDASGSIYKVMVHGSVEANTISTYSDEFARCPRNCGTAYCGASPQTEVYAIYSKGAECW